MKTEIYGIIYKITNLKNGKVYIGQTIKTFDERYYGSIENTGNKHLKNAIEKYGINNFNICKVFDIAFSKDELDIKEKSWISVYKAINREFGYNIAEGGSNGNVFAGKSKEEIKEIGKKISEANKGKKCSEETKRKISEANKNPSDETRRKLSESKKGKNNPMHDKTGTKNPAARKIICITTGEVFEYMSEAIDKYNVHCSNVCKCCNRERNSTGKLNGQKLKWCYLEDYNNEHKGILRAGN